jgi:Mur ligase middle domain
MAPGTEARRRREARNMSAPDHAAVDRAYQAALDDLYASFMRVKQLNKGRFDRDARQPQRLLQIARNGGLLPPLEQTIKVSGSKGKGTTARIAARMLQHEFPHRKIGLFVSPEEDDHNDRMRINGVAMTRAQFVEHYGKLKPQLLAAEGALAGADYLSPLGIFLLIALDWFKTEDVNYFVLETGRGVAHDEVGQIASKIGLLTSIMLEHADKLGPTLEDIARDKLSLCDTCGHVYAPSPVIEAARQFATDRTNELTLVPQPRVGNDRVPAWLRANAELARHGVEHLTGRPLNKAMPTDAEPSASFGLRGINKHQFVFEGLIHMGSLDKPMLDGWQHDATNHNRPVNVIASFPDDKDREQLLAAFHARQWPVTECILAGTRGYLDYARTEAGSTGSHVTFAYDDVAGFAAWLAARPASSKHGRTYLVGTQTYIRLVRKALAQLGGFDAPA